MELDLKKTLSVLLSRIWLIITVAILSGVLFLVANLFFITPMYTSNALLYISNASDRESTVVTSGDINVSRALVDTFGIILDSHTVIDKVIDQSGLDYSYAEIRNTISSTSVSSTEVLRISVTHSNPAEAQILCNAILKVAPGEIKRVMNAGTVSIIDYATLPLAPSSPNIARNTVFGALLGALISAALVLLLHNLDSRVKGEFVLVENFDLPIIGTVPSFGLAERPRPEHTGRRISDGRRTR